MAHFNHSFIRCFIILLGLQACSAAVAPSGCSKLPTDDDWPTAEEWQARLPGIINQTSSDANGPLPNYRIRAKSYSEVQNAVKFAASKNIRLTIITTGHDELGRSDAGSGLIIDLSLLRGARVLKSFTATKEGVESPAADEELKTIEPESGSQAAVTFNPAMGSLAMNYGLESSGLFIVGGTAQGVAIGGGWGQNGGYGPLTAQYGLGVDQWLEAKVVTPDGELRVANEVSNSDLFWAIRGGGGGTFGVVVEATWKVYPTIPILGFHWYINSTLVINDTDAESGKTPTSEALAYLFSVLPELQEKGISAYLFVLNDNIRCHAIHPGPLANAQDANEVWGPILEKMQTYEGMTPFQSKHFHFDSYKEFFQETYGQLEAFNSTDLPRNHGVVPFDSRLLGDEHLKSPNLTHALRKTGGNFGVLMTSPGMAVGNGSNTAVNPGWRKATVLLNGFKSNTTNVDELRELAPDMGTYICEASADEPEWSTSFWGSNYRRLSALKSELDPNMVFWTTPGINADYVKAADGRACLVDPKPETPSQYPPQNERRVIADLENDRNFLFSEQEINGKQFPAPGTLVGLQPA
ncbi:isoamyl alcohol oxidase [Colletotrichum costaricense]|uniref:Isoamyl alcohol oxidase n=1 Tax=Colletotrichum costaricense TaxID=1209916 RepID=A0AAI9YHD3_9PEZI|nr:isoamyl alcohol oxidase [Colletotrichum costaricense]KAK1509331.1 isoamyl alcohol oxidase [Colletotrichum costaricense]